MKNQNEKSKDYSKGDTEKLICKPKERWYDMASGNIVMKTQYTSFWISFALVFGLLVFGSLGHRFFLPTVLRCARCGRESSTTKIHTTV